MGCEFWGLLSEIGLILARKNAEFLWACEKFGQFAGVTNWGDL